jgi:alpha-tubulin suppressor-like RCC1 family protein
MSQVVHRFSPRYFFMYARDWLMRHHIGADPCKSAGVFGLALAVLVFLAACDSLTGPGHRGPTFIDLGSGVAHACGLSETGETYCWGDYEPIAYGGRRFSEEWRRPVRLDGDPGFVALAISSGSNCGITVVGRAYCWGGNNLGYLGDGTRVSRLAAAPVHGELRFRRFADISQTAHMCGLEESGDAYCWGLNNGGQLGADTDELFSTVPVRVDTELRFERLALGAGDSCGVTTPGELYCWGSDNTGQQVVPWDYYGPQPTRLETPVPFDTVALTSTVMCGLADGRAYCRGWNGAGTLGANTDETFSAEFVPIAGDHRFASIHLGFLTACGLTSAGEAYCWGHGSRGKLGTGSEENGVLPARVPGDLRFRKLAPGIEHNCGLTTGGAIYCWGDNSHGQLGIGTDREISWRPVRIAPPID